MGSLSYGVLRLEESLGTGVMSKVARMIMYNMNFAPVHLNFAPVHQGFALVHLKFAPITSSSFALQVADAKLSSPSSGLNSVLQERYYDVVGNEYSSSSFDQLE
ncbi:hypothetical protein L6452_02069 [Arctium lappa]|uniref:Uncharacterized protein n=1 Tax=Arctium lappa TaxID=4217 RepID=A0ACB9FJP5_ARCLA|nr:hypothetical protein L6452_02069 [Arctium lappa]